MKMVKFHVRKLPFMFPVVIFWALFFGNGQTVQTRQTQTWIVELVAKCLRMDPHIVSLA